MKFILKVIRNFWEDDCMSHGENISFCALLAVIPISMFVIAIAGFFLGASDAAFGKIVEVATDVLPVGRDIFVANLQSVLDQRASLGIVSLVGLVFIATILVDAIERSLDVVFRTTSRRHFLYLRLLGVALIFWVTLLFSLPTVVNILDGVLARFGVSLPFLGLMSGKAYFFLVAFLAYLMLIVVIPNKKIYARYAAVGGAFFSIAIGVAKFIFNAYLALTLQRYNIVYGSLAAVVLFVLWIYYLSVLMLFSAELVAELQERRVFHRRAAAEKA